MRTLTKENFIKEYADNRESMSMEESLGQMFDKYLSPIIEQKKRDALRRLSAGRKQAHEFLERSLTIQQQISEPEKTLKDFLKKLMDKDPQCYALAWVTDEQLHFAFITVAGNGKEVRETVTIPKGEPFDNACYTMINKLESLQVEGAFKVDEEA
jgi:predicted RNase H-like nuclease (RuvC/YqgF family)